MTKGMYMGGADLYFNGNALPQKLYDPNNFTYAAYRSQINAALEAGYEFVNFECREIDPGQKIIQLRHDEPFSLAASLEIAKINKELGVTGTFFVDPQNAFYCLDDESQQAILVEIQSLEQNIALKINPRDENGKLLSIDEIKHHVEISAKKFAEQTGSQPTAFAFDTTGMEREGLSPSDPAFDNLHGMQNVYAFKLSSDEVGVDLKPLGNSNGMHLYGENLNDMIDADVSAIQMHVHPCWVSEEPMLPYQRLLQFVMPSDLEQTLGLVHSGGRVYAGDGHKPEIDAHIKAVISPASPAPSVYPGHDLQ